LLIVILSRRAARLGFDTSSLTGVGLARLPGPAQRSVPVLYASSLPADRLVGGGQSALVAELAGAGGF
jgi:hypothetical protein